MLLLILHVGTTICFLGWLLTFASTILRVTLMTVPWLFFGAEGVVPLFCTLETAGFMDR